MIDVLLYFSDLFTLKKANIDGPSYCNLEPEKTPIKPLLKKSEKPCERKKSANELFLERCNRSVNKSQRTAQSDNQTGTSKQSNTKLKHSMQSMDQSKSSAQSNSQSNDLMRSGNAPVSSDSDVSPSSPSDVSSNGQYKLDDATANKYKLQSMTWLEMLKDQRYVSLTVYSSIYLISEALQIFI